MDPAASIGLFHINHPGTYPLRYQRGIWNKKIFKREKKRKEGMSHELGTMKAKCNAIETVVQPVNLRRISKGIIKMTRRPPSTMHRRVSIRGYTNLIFSYSHHSFSSDRDKRCTRWILKDAPCEALANLKRGRNGADKRGRDRFELS